MALPGVPAIMALPDCASYAVTVQPYLQQLPALPSAIFEALKTSKAAVANFYVDTNPFVLALFFSIFLGAVFFVAAEITGDYSQVDRMWPILPAVYVWHYNIWARHSGIPHARLDLAVVCVTLWSCRLTFNFWRKGGYSKGGEDYRWAIIKEKIGPVAMFIFDATFISFMQSILLCLVTSPGYVLLLTSRVQPDLTLPDVIFTSLILCLLTIETVADQQQWDYHQAKHAYLNTAKLPLDSKYSQEDLDRGFVVSGLWSWSRHPNFACEMSIWVTFYHWAGFASSALINWTIVGMISYVMIFMGSTPLTEAISSKKYPQYREYQQLVGRFFPGVLGGVWKNKKD